GLEQAEMYDGVEDDECAAVNGQIVTLSEAESLMADEHPNGTRAVAPIVRVPQPAVPELVAARASAPTATKERHSPQARVAGSYCNRSSPPYLALVGKR